MKNEYFIIESLPKDDIHDGKIFYDALKSSGIYEPIYKVVTSATEFETALKIFETSGCKFLFISAHGDEENITLIDGDYNAYDLADLDLHLPGRRVFLSTCRGGSFIFARYFIKKGVYSVIGSPDDLSQIVATAIWTTMAILFERLNSGGIKYEELNTTMKVLSDVYGIDLAYFSFIRDKPKMKRYFYSSGLERIKEVYNL
ncbi:hypothetical protein V9K67_20690 [Paraflavisolibacter sp. H34]|uniref:hypothetical protein n=1 Tax=Huijunlia imazamoxiresistens TaxID=3127457 RepID=UPI00301B5F85